MLRFSKRSLLLCIVAVSIAGCKSDDLSGQAATNALETTLFAPAGATQTTTFVVGAARPAKPYAIDGFLYAKRWLTCSAEQPGLFSSTSVCELDSAGRTYAASNGWTSVRGGTAGGNACEKCETWTVPVARAKLRRVSDIHRTGKDAAGATFAYDVTPNEFGNQLGAWMAQNAKAWCGPDPRSVGVWGAERSGNARFERANGTWRPVDQPSFATTFGSGAVPPRACV